MKKVGGTQMAAGRDRPIGVSWGRVARQVLAFLLAVALIFILLVYLKTFTL
jgi:hypothetical protein